MEIQIGLSIIECIIIGVVLGISLTICAQIGFMKLKAHMENIGGEKVVSIGTIGN